MVLEIKISTHFKDCYGNTRNDNLTLPIENDCSDAAMMTQANDLATDWFYSVADDFCSQIWREEGGGTDYEYEFFFEKYLENCSLNWSYKKNWD